MPRRQCHATAVITSHSTVKTPTASHPAICKAVTQTPPAADKAATFLFGRKCIMRQKSPQSRRISLMVEIIVLYSIICALPRTIDFFAVGTADGQRFVYTAADFRTRGRQEINSGASSTCCKLFAVPSLDTAGPSAKISFRDFSMRFAVWIVPFQFNQFCGVERKSFVLVVLWHSGRWVIQKRQWHTPV